MALARHYRYDSRPTSWARMWVDDSRRTSRARMWVGIHSDKTRAIPHAAPLVGVARVRTDRLSILTDPARPGDIRRHAARGQPDQEAPS